MMKQFIFVFLTLITGLTFAQQKTIKAPDSVIVKAGKSSVIVVIRDSADIKTIRRYDMDAIVEDALRQIETDSSKRVSAGLLYQYKKYPGLKFSFEPEVDTLVANKLRDRARMLALEELEWLEMQEEFLESGSEFDRAELKRIIKERAERLKEKTKALSDPETGARYEFRIDRGRIDESDDEEEEEADSDYKEKKRRTYQSTHFDLGASNYLTGGKFPDEINAPYTLSPRGSSYVALNNIYRTRLANKMFLEWGLGVSAYIFKFQNDSMQILRTSGGVDFMADTSPVDYRKSKLMTYFLQASFVPVIDFGGNSRKPGIFDGVGARSFRIGAGPYAGYRFGSYSKRVYKEDGERQRIRNHDNFYLNNFRYGLRLQIGYRETDLFFSYDMNELFTRGKGPGLNAFSFGISF